MPRYQEFNNNLTKKEKEEQKRRVEEEKKKKKEAKGCKGYNSFSNIYCVTFFSYKHFLFQHPAMLRNS
jgi:hypothetical protein